MSHRYRPNDNDRFEKKILDEIKKKNRRDKRLPYKAYRLYKADRFFKSIFGSNKTRDAHKKRTKNKTDDLGWFDW